MALWPLVLKSIFFWSHAKEQSFHFSLQVGIATEPCFSLDLCEQRKDLSGLESEVYTLQLEN